MQSFTQSLALSLPEAILAVGALVLLLIGAFRGDRSLGLLSWLCVGLYAAAGLALPARRSDSADQHIQRAGDVE